MAIETALLNHASVFFYYASWSFEYCVYHIYTITYCIEDAVIIVSFGPLDVLKGLADVLDVPLHLSTWLKPFSQLEAKTARGHTKPIISKFTTYINERKRSITIRIRAKVY